MLMRALVERDRAPASIAREFLSRVGGALSASFSRARDERGL